MYSAKQIRSAAAMSLMRWAKGANSATAVSAMLTTINGQ
jgi:hypothetical protein